MNGMGQLFYLLLQPLFWASSDPAFLNDQWLPKPPSLYARLCSKCCKCKDVNTVLIPKQLIDNEETNAAAERSTGNKELQREETEPALKVGRVVGGHARRR